MFVKVPGSYASRLTFDSNLGQEVITVDTPLSKEIIVDSGTKVDTLRYDILQGSTKIIPYYFGKVYLGWV